MFNFRKIFSILSMLTMAIRRMNYAARKPIVQSDSFAKQIAVWLRSQMVSIVWLAMTPSVIVENVNVINGYINVWIQIVVIQMKVEYNNLYLLPIALCLKGSIKFSHKGTTQFNSCIKDSACPDGYFCNTYDYNLCTSKYLEGQPCISDNMCKCGKCVTKQGRTRLNSKQIVYSICNGCD